MSNIQKIVEQVKALPREEFDEFLSWLVSYELDEPDPWDQELERDSQPGGRLAPILKRVHDDVAAGRTQPLDEFLNDA